MKSLLFLLCPLLALAQTTPREAYEMAGQGQAVIIDVREAHEIKVGMLERARWFPLSKIRAGKDWKEDFQALAQGKRVFLYCRSGNRSGQALEALKANGIAAENLGGYLTLKDKLPTVVPAEK